MTLDSGQQVVGSLESQVFQITFEFISHILHFCSPPLDILWWHPRFLPSTFHSFECTPAAPLSPGPFSESATPRPSTPHDAKNWPSWITSYPTSTCWLVFKNTKENACKSFTSVLYHPSSCCYLRVEFCFQIPKGRHIGHLAFVQYILDHCWCRNVRSCAGLKMMKTWRL